MNENVESFLAKAELLRMATDIVTAYVSQNSIPGEDLPSLISRVVSTLDGLGNGAGTSEEEARKPAVSVRRSVTPDYIVCLEDGRKLKMLKRHLRTAYDMTPDEYRIRWNLPADYPMVAPNYAKKRSEFAKKIGLGRKSA